VNGLPFALLAELTHRCPLHCVYCSNPIGLTRAELDTAEWIDVLNQSRDLGVVQLQLSGGEPLLREDLELLIAHAVELGMYTHLVTSAVGLDRERSDGLEAAGLQSVQVSFQADEPSLGDRIAGRKAHAGKLDALLALGETKFALGLNVVIHALNIDRLEAIVELCMSFSPQRIELANAQYYGWALLNRSALLPTRAQLARAQRTYDRLRAQLEPEVEVIWVLPDYYERFPKPCMGGWARHSLTVAPNGTVLPCLAAGAIETLSFESVRERSLAWIWHESAAFNAFRGVKWMPEPCRSCDRRHLDHGGCRCQAFLLTGDAAGTDPVCVLAPDHGVIETAVAGANDPDRARRQRRLIHRRFREPQPTRLTRADSAITKELR
jgi:PqqA peptide cyclase